MARQFDVRLTVRCGETTCAVAPGNFCPWVATANFGQRFHCGIFGTSLNEDDAGWLARCPECLKAEAGGDKGTEG